MPITQDRMLDLLEAANDYQGALQLIINQLRRELNSFHAGLIEPGTFISNIEYISQSEQTFMKHAIKSATTLAVETAHFKPSRIRQNERIANLQRNKRRADGIMPSRSESYQQKIERELSEELNASPSSSHTIHRPKLTRARLSKLDPDCTMTPYEIEELTNKLERRFQRDPDGIQDDTGGGLLGGLGEDE